MLNNSISSHRTNKYTPCPLDELLAYAQSKRRQQSAIVYGRRTGTPDIFEDLRKTKITAIKKTGNLISRSKRQNPAVFREYLQLHQSSELELKSLRVVHHYGLCCPIESTCQGFSQRYGPRPKNHRRDVAGQRRGEWRCWLDTFSRSRTTIKW